MTFFAATPHPLRRTPLARLRRSITWLFPPSRPLTSSSAAPWLTRNACLATLLLYSACVPSTGAGFLSSCSYAVIAVCMAIELFSNLSRKAPPSLFTSLGWICIFAVILLILMLSWFFPLRITASTPGHSLHGFKLYYLDTRIKPSRTSPGTSRPISSIVPLELELQVTACGTAPSPAYHTTLIQ
jgi:hypothetical protein